MYQLDKATGEPLWSVEVIDADPQAVLDREDQGNIAASAGDAACGRWVPFVPVEFASLTVSAIRAFSVRVGTSGLARSEGLKHPTF